MYQFKCNDPDFLPHFGCEIELSLAPGEVLFLTGENGIGKTSLMRRFSSSSSQKISFIEQGKLDFFYDRKLGTLKEVLLLSRRNEIAKSFLDLSWSTFGLHLKENRFLTELSGGEGQALKLCFGLCANSDLFFLDEPTQYLDQQSKAKLTQLMRVLIDQRKSFLVIEHDLTWGEAGARVQELNLIDKSLRVNKTWTM